MSDILFRMALGQVSQAEIDKFANMTGEQLNAALKGQYEKLRVAHATAQAGLTRDAVREAGARVKAEQNTAKMIERLLADRTRAEAKAQREIEASIKKAVREEEAAAKKISAALKEEERQRARLGKEAEKAADAVARAAERRVKEEEKANRASTTSWRRAWEDMENVSTVAIAAMSGAAGLLALPGKIKAWGDEIIRVSDVYSSLRGSIDEMRTATNGQVRDIDLITTKNRAFEKDLNITDERFADLSKQAMKFSDAIGTDVKEALDKLVDGFANANARALRQAGILVDVEKAEARYAEAIGKTVDKLTEQEKKVAIQEAAFRKLDEKLLEAGNDGTKFADALERVFARVASAWDRMLARIGGNKALGALTAGAADFFDSDRSILNNIEEALALIAGQEGMAQENLGRRMANLDAEEFKALRIEAKRKARVANDKLKDQAIVVGEPMGPREATGEEIMKASEEAKRRRSEASKRASELAISRRKREAEATAAMERSAQLRDVPTEHMDSFETDFLREYGAEEAMERSADLADERLFSRATSPFMLSAEAEAATEDALTKSRESIAAIRAEAMKGLQESGLEGHGLLYGMLFGDAGSPEELADRVLEFGQGSLEVMGELQNAGGAMQAAFASAMAAAVSGSGSFSQVLKEQMKAFGIQLSTKGYWKMLEQLAEGFSAAANPVTAALAPGHFFAAAKWGLLATAAGYGARAFSTGGTGGSAGSATGAARRGSDFDSSPRPIRRESRDEEDKRPVTLYQTVFPGGEKAAAQALADLLETHWQYRGRKPWEA